MNFGAGTTVYQGTIVTAKDIFSSKQMELREETVNGFKSIFNA